MLAYQGNDYYEKHCDGQKNAYFQPPGQCKSSRSLMTAILLSSPPAQLFFMTPQPSIETGWSVGKPGAMQIQIRNRCSDFNSYRAARVKSLFTSTSLIDRPPGAVMRSTCTLRKAIPCRVRRSSLPSALRLRRSHLGSQGFGQRRGSRIRRSRGRGAQGLAAAR